MNRVVGFSNVYSRTYGSGARVPNYTPFPPEGLAIEGSPVTVATPARVSDLLKPGMGDCHWAACTWNPKAENANLMYDTSGVIDTKGISNSKFWQYMKIYSKD